MAFSTTYSSACGIKGAAGWSDSSSSWTTGRQRYPAVRLDAAKALVDGGRGIAAGAITAHTDLTLLIPRRLFGAALARKVIGIMLILEKAVRRLGFANSVQPTHLSAGSVRRIRQGVAWKHAPESWADRWHDWLWRLSFFRRLFVRSAGL